MKSVLEPRAQRIANGRGTEGEKTRADLLIRGGTIVTMNPKREVLEGDLLVADGRIQTIGNNLEADALQTIDACGRLVIPGLIQTHVHFCQTLFRGQADDLPLMDWLVEKIWPMEAAHDEESVYDSALLSCAELLSSGTTTALTMETVRHTESAFHAASQSGIRAFMGKALMDVDNGILWEKGKQAIEESLRLAERWHMAENGRLRYALCPRFVLSCTDGLLKDVVEIAKEHGFLIHTHAAENEEEVELVMRKKKMRNIAFLHKLGLTGPSLLLAHCIWVDEEELAILRETGTRVLHCPSANLKLASGYAPVPEMLERGVHVSLGADGAPCNNNLDVFNEMRLAALIHKPTYGSTAMTAERVFQMATLDGARALGLENELGSLEVGKKADIAILERGSIDNIPLVESAVYSTLVYSYNSRDVRDVIVDGRVVMRERDLTHIDTDLLSERCNRSIRRLKERVGKPVKGR